MMCESAGVQLFGTFKLRQLLQFIGEIAFVVYLLQCDCATMSSLSMNCFPSEVTISDQTDTHWLLLRGEERSVGKWLMDRL
jgi:hypothetical protein